MERKKPHPDNLEQRGSVAPQVPPLLGRKFANSAPPKYPLLSRTLTWPPSSPNLPIHKPPAFSLYMHGAWMEVRGQCEGAGTFHHVSHWIKLRSSSLAGGASDSLSRLIVLWIFFFCVAPNGSNSRPGIWQETEEQTVRTLSLESESLRLAPNSSSQL